MYLSERDPDLQRQHSDEVRKHTFENTLVENGVWHKMRQNYGSIHTWHFGGRPGLIHAISAYFLYLFSCISLFVFQINCNRNSYEVRNTKIQWNRDLPLKQETKYILICLVFNSHRSTMWSFHIDYLLPEMTRKHAISCYNIVIEILNYLLYWDRRFWPTWPGPNSNPVSCAYAVSHNVPIAHESCTILSYVI